MRKNCLKIGVEKAMQKTCENHPKSHPKSMPKMIDLAPPKPSQMAPKSQNKLYFVIPHPYREG